MTNTNRSQRRKQRQERRLVVRAVRRDPVDVKKWGGALIELAQAQDEADAEAEQVRRQAVQRRRSGRRHDADEPTGGAA